ncbi:dTDP-4-dehydrorhamnose reductase [Methanobrevibacter sp. 87.7]|uniref:dTDP-4-dehydrorhamnose reductase n=1 Tax=Methanobrevibacter sp. 87.7 TaxID=387957 RepID=UPI000B51120B|nr:dTDP-4-dehydrorhamnose reductase [Methanobrevibacter sp. 87.7]OWT33809.1 dTDP-4-dehydrorhamnose reductase [Methanobrevibacter sp. 87.7]
MRILVTGANGMLGTDLCEILKDEDLIAASHKDLDITDLEMVKSKFNEYMPDVIINCAAMTNVDACETEKDLAYSLNAEGPKNLALATKEIDGTLIHISTDYVFKGDKHRPLRENDEIGPDSVYGKSKLQGEEAIENILDKYFIIRTAWLYGVHGPNFIKKMLELSENHDTLTVVNDQEGSPTFTKDLSIAIKEIIYSNKYGIYHVTNSGNTTWYDFAKLIFEKKGIDVNVEAVSSEEFAAPAPRPHYSVLSHDKWIKNGFTELRDYKDALDEYLQLL